MDAFEKKIRTRLAREAKLLGVSDYVFHVKIKKNRKPSDKYDTYGSVIIDEESREVVLSINKKLLKQQPKEVVSTVVHELLHVRLSELLTLMEVILKLYVKDKKAKKAYTEQIEHLEHKIIVSITEAIVKHGK